MYVANVCKQMVPIFKSIDVLSHRIRRAVCPHRGALGLWTIIRLTFIRSKLSKNVDINIIFILNVYTHSMCSKVACLPQPVQDGSSMSFQGCQIS